MGQDREYSQSEIEDALRTARSYKERWEEAEKANLEFDIIKRIEQIAADKAYKEQHEQADNHEMDKEIEDSMIQREGEEPLDDDTKVQKQRMLRFKLMRKQFYVSEEEKKKPPKKKENPF